MMVSSQANQKQTLTAQVEVKTNLEFAPAMMFVMLDLGMLDSNVPLFHTYNGVVGNSSGSFFRFSFCTIVSELVSTSAVLRWTFSHSDFGHINFALNTPPLPISALRKFKAIGWLFWKPEWSVTTMTKQNLQNHTVLFHALYRAQTI